MKKHKEKSKDKKKKPKLTARRSFSNLLFALRQVWEVSPSYFILYYVMTFLYAPLDFLTGSFLIRLIVDGVEEGKSTQGILAYMLVICAIAMIIRGISKYYWNVISPREYQKIGATVQKKLFQKAAEVELACYETPSFYDKYFKAMDEALDRVRKVMETLDNLIWDSISLLCNSVLLFVIDPWLLVFGAFPLMLGFVRRWGNRLKHDHAAADKPLKRRNQYVRRTFYLNDYAKEMRIGSMHERMLRELNCVFADAKTVWRKYGIKRGIARFLQNVGLEVVTVLGAMLYAVWRTLGVGALSIGDCIVILNSIGTISYCLNFMVQTFAEFGEHALFLEDVRYFLDYESKMPDDPEAPLAHGGEIVLENVSFRYDGAEEDVLQDVSLRIRKGEHVALVGANGSGKTTLVKLLLRLYDPTAGVIRLDGRDIREYRLSSYRDNYSCVLQDFRVFSLSVRENVVLRRSREGDAELVTDALRESGAWSKIETLEEGIESTLTREFDDEGINLSVGEQQKVSLARVFAEDAPCVVLDEPSSALDPIAEHTMFENMMRASRGRSVIFISHRLSSAVDADRIYLMDHGRILEEGTHHELMERNGKYAEMFRLQAENYIGREVQAP